MAIGAFYDIDRDQYGGMDHYRRQEQEWQQRRAQEEVHRRMQQAAYYNPAQQQAGFGLMANTATTAPKPDLKDPLAFLQNTDKKLLLTGEMQ